jgi:hypothetical protein
MLLAPVGSRRVEINPEFISTIVETSDTALDPTVISAVSSDTPTTTDASLPITTTASATALGPEFLPGKPFFPAPRIERSLGGALEGAASGLIEPIVSSGKFLPTAYLLHNPEFVQSEAPLETRSIPSWTNCSGPVLLQFITFLLLISVSY